LKTKIKKTSNKMSENLSLVEIFYAKRRQISSSASAKQLNIAIFNA
jgi:hypothetical protein